jgi:hypothetical protein
LVSRFTEPLTDPPQGNFYFEAGVNAGCAELVKQIAQAEPRYHPADALNSATVKELQMFLKRNETGKVTHFKAHLVCGGNHKTQGINFSATYAPLAHIRLMSGIAAKLDLDFQQMEVMTAFLG